MGQFKPMVKMMTTEPSVELKLKKGGKVEKKMQMGGLPSAAPEAMPSAMPARGGMMAAKAPMRPSMAARRQGDGYACKRLCPQECRQVCPLVCPLPPLQCQP
jgi:hypothetical protein